MRAKLKEINEELRKRMHQPIPEQGAWLKTRRGWFQLREPIRLTGVRSARFNGWECNSRRQRETGWIAVNEPFRQRGVPQFVDFLNTAHKSNG